MRKQISKAIMVFLTLAYFTASIYYNKQPNSLDLFWKVFFFVKEELLVLGLCWYSYTKATNSYSIFCIIAIGMYSFIQMLVYIITALFANTTIEYALILSNPWVSITSSVICAIVIILLNYLFKNQHRSNIKYLINLIK